MTICLCVCVCVNIYNIFADRTTGSKKFADD